jgi:hypothetical protein
MNNMDLFIRSRMLQATDEGATPFRFFQNVFYHVRGEDEERGDPFEELLPPELRFPPELPRDLPIMRNPPLFDMGQPPSPDPSDEERPEEEQQPPEEEPIPEEEEPREERPRAFHHRRRRTIEFLDRMLKARTGNTSYEDPASLDEAHKMKRFLEQEIQWTSDMLASDEFIRSFEEGRTRGGPNEITRRLEERLRWIAEQMDGLEKKMEAIRKAKRARFFRRQRDLEDRDNPIPPDMLDRIEEDRRQGSRAGGSGAAGPVAWDRRLAEWLTSEQMEAVRGWVAANPRGMRPEDLETLLRWRAEFHETRGRLELLRRLAPLLQRALTEWNQWNAQKDREEGLTPEGTKEPNAASVLSDFRARPGFVRDLGILRLRLTPVAGAHDDREAWERYVRQTLDYFLLPQVRLGRSRNRVMLQFRTQNFRGVDGVLRNYHPLVRERDVSNPADYAGLLDHMRTEMQGWWDEHEKYSVEDAGAGVSRPGDLLLFEHVDLYITMDHAFGCVGMDSLFDRRLRQRFLWMPVLSGKNTNSCAFECFVRGLGIANKTAEWMRYKAGCPKGRPAERRHLQRMCDLFEHPCEVWTLDRTRKGPGTDPWNLLWRLDPGRGEGGEDEDGDEDLMDDDMDDVEFLEDLMEDEGGEEAAEDPNEDGVIRLLLMGTHFALVTRKKMLDMRACRNCGDLLMKPNLPQHESRCTMCQRCKTCYVRNPNKEHVCGTKRLEFVQKGYVPKDRIRYRDRDEGAKKWDREVCVADFETFHPSDGIHEESVYAVGCEMLGSDETEIFGGEDCLDRFCDRLHAWSGRILAADEKDLEERTALWKAQGGTKGKAPKLVVSYGTLCFYNGSKFDCFLLLRKLVDKGIRVTKLVMSNGTLLSFVCFGNIRLFDLIRFTLSSLDQACKDFGSPVKKGSFDHRKVRSWEDVARWEHEWRPYLESDVKGTKGVYRIFADFFWNTFAININSCVTLSQAAYQYWCSLLKDDVRIPDNQLDDFLRRGVYGGRCFPQKQLWESPDFDERHVKKKKVTVFPPDPDEHGVPVKEPTELEADVYDGEELENIRRYLVDTDVVSLYPTAMCNHFPAGEHRWVPASELEAMGKAFNDHSPVEEWRLRLCVTEVDMEVPTDLVTPALPRKGPGGKGILWNLLPIRNQVYTGVDILRGIRYGYEVTRVHRAVRWDVGAPVFKSFVEMLVDMKKKAAKGSAMYSIAKLTMNGLYGKTIMRPVRDAVEIATDRQQMEKFRAKHDLQFIYFLGEERPDSIYWDGPVALKASKKNFYDYFNFLFKFFSRRERPWTWKSPSPNPASWALSCSLSAGRRWTAPST